MHPSIAIKPTVVVTCRHLAKLGALLYGSVWVPPPNEEGLSQSNGNLDYGEERPPDKFCIRTEHTDEIYRSYASQDEYMTDEEFEEARVRNPMIIFGLPYVAITKKGTDKVMELASRSLAECSGYQVVWLGHGMDSPFLDEFHEAPNCIDITDGNFSEGSQHILQCCAANLPTVNTDKTTWRQIEQFLEDPESTWKYRNFRIWLQEGVKAQSLSHAQDILEKKLEDYTWSLRKHGVETVAGIVDQFFDPKTLIAAGTGAGLASLTTSPTMAALAGGLILGSKVSLYAARRIVDKEDVTKYNKNGDVALLYSALKKFEGNLTFQSNGRAKARR